MGAKGSGGAGFLLGLVVGTLTGAAIGVLLAPRSGDLTRAQLREQADWWREEARERFPEVRERAEELASTARSRSQMAVEGVRGVADRFRPGGEGEGEPTSPDSSSMR